MSGRVLVYGATGFSGRLIAERLQQAGHDVVLAGRNAERLGPVASALGLPRRAFDLDDAGRIDHGLADIRAVLHAAGPFSRTAAPMIDACIRTRTHYLDLAGEWPVFQLAQRRGLDAAAQGVMLMPGVGFSITASDCLLAHAARQVPDATLLRVAISRPEIMSRGTLRSVLQLTSPTMIVRREGRLHHLPVGRLERRFDYGSGERTSVAVSWPDVVTGEQTTGIGSIEAYAEAGWTSRLAYRTASIAAGLFDTASMQRTMQSLSAAWPEAPSTEARGKANHTIVVEAVDQWRRTTRFRLRTLDGYTVSALTAEAIVVRVLGDDCAPGFQTPAGLYGAELITRLGCAWHDTPAPAAVQPL